MDDPKIRGRLAALERLVVILLKEHARDPETRRKLLSDLDLLSDNTPKWFDLQDAGDQEAARHYRIALLELPELLGPDRPR